MEALQRNPKALLENLDAANNLIALGLGVRRYLDAFKAPNPDTVPTLHLNLVGNSLVRDYPEPRKVGKGTSTASSMMKKKPALKVVTHFSAKKLPDGTFCPSNFYGYAGFNPSLKQLELVTHTLSGQPLKSDDSVANSATSGSVKKAKKLTSRTTGALPATEGGHSHLGIAGSLRASGLTEPTVLRTKSAK